MKTMIRLSALCVVALGLAGCAENNEANVMKDPSTGKTTAAGVTPPSASRSSADFANKSAANNPMKNNPEYQKAGK